MGPHNGRGDMQKVLHLQFSVEVYWDQISRGEFFLHEHPATASSWDLSSIRELAEHPGVTIVIGDMCRWEMHPSEEIENQENRTICLG